MSHDKNPLDSCEVCFQGTGFDWHGIKVCLHCQEEGKKLQKHAALSQQGPKQMVLPPLVDMFKILREENMKTLGMDKVDLSQGPFGAPATPKSTVNRCEETGDTFCQVCFLETKTKWKNKVFVCPSCREEAKALIARHRMLEVPRITSMEAAFGTLQERNEQYIEKQAKEEDAQEKRSKIKLVEGGVDSPDNS